MRKSILFLVFALTVSLSTEAQRNCNTRGNRCQASVQKNNARKNVKVVSNRNTNVTVVNKNVTVTNTRVSRPNCNNVNSGYKIVRYGNSTYYHDGRNYYRKNGLNYSYCYPPTGLHISSIPSGYKMIKHGNRSYYYCDGIVYESLRSGVYSVVKPIVGMMLPSLPLNFVSSVTRSGKRYYCFGGMLYSKVNYRGSMVYRVVGAY